MRLTIPQSGINIPRHQLPQISSSHVVDFLAFLKKHGVKTTKETVRVDSIHPSQSNFNQSKIRSLMTDNREHLKKPIIISNDSVLLDGHHRWLALLNLDKSETLQAYRVHCSFLDLIRLSKEYPNVSYKTIVEDTTPIQRTTLVCAHGRFQPPTIGHELVGKVIQEHLTPEAVGRIYVSHKVDSTKNPLSQEYRIELLETVFPFLQIRGVQPLAPSMIQILKEAQGEGFTDVIYVAGEDRVAEFQSLLERYNGKEYSFNSIRVVSAGSRNDEDYGVVSASGTQMRILAEARDLDTFQLMLPESLQSRAQEILETINPPPPELLEEGVHDAAIFKAVFLAGGSGSGKDYVMHQTLDGHGLVEINSDQALEFLMDKHKLDKKMPSHEEGQRDFIRGRAKSITELKQRLAIHGRNGLIINGTGADVDKVKKIKEMLDEFGYESQMVFVNASNDISRKRNLERGQRGGRLIPEKIRQEKWEEAQLARGKYEGIFGKENFTEFDNSEDLRGEGPNKGTPRDLMTRHAEKYKELMGIYKKVKAFVSTPPQHEVAQAWIQQQKGNLASHTAPAPEKPVQKSAQKSGSSTQSAPQKKAIPLQPVKRSSPAKGVSDEAKRMGLEYYGFGRYGKKGHVSYLSVDGHLVRKNPIHVMAPPPAAPKAPSQKPAPALREAINQQFSKLFTEDRHEPIQEIALAVQQTRSPLSSTSAPSDSVSHGSGVRKEQRTSQESQKEKGDQVRTHILRKKK